MPNDIIYDMLDEHFTHSCSTTYQQCMHVCSYFFEVKECNNSNHRTYSLCSFLWECSTMK